MQAPFILYDSEALTSGALDCLILDTAESESEAVEASDSWQDVEAIWFEGPNPRYDLPPYSSASEDIFIDELEGGTSESVSDI